MTEPILLAKNLDGMRRGSKTYARLLAAEVGSTLALLRFEPPLPPARAAAVHVPR